LEVNQSVNQSIS